MWVRRDPSSIPLARGRPAARPMRCSDSPGGSRACSARSSSTSRPTAAISSTLTLRPTLETARGRGRRRAVPLAARVPADLPTWHYDEVDAALVRGDRRDGRDLAGRVRGPSRSPPVYDRLDPIRTSPGPPASARTRAVTDGRSPARAATSRGVRRDRGAVVIRGTRARRRERHGVRPCRRVRRRRAARRDRRRRARDHPRDRRGRDDHLSPTPQFPEIEDAAWSSINAALRGELTPAEAVGRMQASAEAALAATSVVARAQLDASQARQPADRSDRAEGRRQGRGDRRSP